MQDSFMNSTTTKENSFQNYGNANQNQENITMVLHNKKLINEEKAQYKEYLDFMLNEKKHDHLNGG